MLSDVSCLCLSCEQGGYSRGFIPSVAWVLTAMVILIVWLMIVMLMVVMMVMMTVKVGMVLRMSSMTVTV